MKSLSEFVDFWEDYLASRATFLPYSKVLDQAAKKLISGYLDLEDASEETLIRIDEFGNEIFPSVIHEAVEYLRGQK